MEHDFPRTCKGLAPTYPDIIHYGCHALRAIQSIVTPLGYARYNDRSSYYHQYTVPLLVMIKPVPEPRTGNSRLSNTDEIMIALPGQDIEEEMLSTHNGGY
ncbi:hypothetical protein J6590_094256 [Homalodisca vitripennis]|nr:hypothetical protein J6590_086925 [Homalodisca vitripennis]KAG8319329.1 hypothetical protein J6590_094256 [Homalodisca vitripennis]